MNAVHTATAAAAAALVNPAATAAATACHNATTPAAAAAAAAAYNAAATVVPFTLATLNAALDTVTVAQLAVTKKALKGVDLKAQLSAYLKTGMAGYAKMGGYYAVFLGILDALSAGQKTALNGFAVASKKSANGCFAMLQAMGVLSYAGSTGDDKKDAVKPILGFEKGVKDSAALEKTQARVIEFISLCYHAELSRVETARLERESKAAAADADATATAPDTGETMPDTVIELTEGQKDDAAISYLIARLASAKMADDSVKTLLAAIGAMPVMAATVAAAAAAAAAAAEKAAIRAATAAAEKAAADTAAAAAAMERVAEKAAEKAAELKAATPITAPVYLNVDPVAAAAAEKAAAAAAKKAATAAAKKAATV